jgi:tetratricopeptide (TPR) repeat protein
MEIGRMPPDDFTDERYNGQGLTVLLEGDRRITKTQVKYTEKYDFRNGGRAYFYERVIIALTDEEADMLTKYPIMEIRLQPSIRGATPAKTLNSGTDVYKCVVQSSSKVAKREAIKNSFKAFADDYVATALTKWKQKGEFEKTADYQARTNAENTAKQKAQLRQQAEKAYTMCKGEDGQYKLCKSFKFFAATMKEFVGSISTEAKALASFVPNTYEMSAYNADDESFNITLHIDDNQYTPITLTVKVPPDTARIISKENAVVGRDLYIKNPGLFVYKDRLALATGTFEFYIGKKDAGKDYYRQVFYSSYYQHPQAPAALIAEIQRAEAEARAAEQREQAAQQKKQAEKYLSEARELSKRFSTSEAEKIITHYENAWKILPDSKTWEDMYNYGLMSVKLNDTKRIAWYKSILENSGVLEAKLHQQLGLFYAKCKNYKDAVTEYRMAVDKSDKNDANLKGRQSDLALAYYEWGKYAEALKIMDKYVDTYPNDAGGHILLGHIYCEMREKRKANKSYEKATKLDGKKRSECK